MEQRRQMGSKIAIHKAFIKGHDEKTLSCTTSRNQFFASLGEDDEIRINDESVSWLLTQSLRSSR